jgi:hypothetical protein
MQMKPPVKRYIQNRSSEEEVLKKRLALLIACNVIAGIVIISSVTVFGPVLGGLFAFISVHRNDKDSLMIPLPNPPIFSNIPTATKDDKVTINGYAEPGSTVRIYVNGPEAGSAIADTDGLFTFLDLPLIKGNNTIFGKTTDATNRESEPSETITIGYDTDKPTITIETPKNGDVVKNLDKSVLVRGKLDKKAEVKVNGRLAILKSDNTFEVLLGASEGKMEIKVSALDGAGNKEEKAIVITYVKSGI